ncbi:MAG: hypothetical protein SLAVMIC_00824 [uncultured marine phage]|uniref:Uncharacterized protein n=1 Tax=uncultured marine phage TaxID=707152 RepID=A0A8D9FRV5_9VIRU|nr:MAG: hypothetical protein SLAVMIC_00824 [uncultured marine phage]
MLANNIDNVHEDVEKVKESKLYRRLNTLQSEIEDLKDYLVAEKYKAATNKLMEEVDDSYKKEISTLIVDFVNDIDMDEIDFDVKNFNGIEVTEDQKIISDKFSVELKTDFIDSDFIKNWDGDIFNNENHKFSMTYGPEGETLNLFLNKLKGDNLIFTIDEEELKVLPFMRTLFKRSEFWEIQVLRKADLKFKFNEDDNSTDIEFETIKFK